MKKFTACFMRVLVMLLFICTYNGNAQCTASFNYSLGANGYVSFTSTAVGTNSATTFYSWNLGNTTYTSGINLVNPTATYTANGTYTVVMTFSNPCASSASAAITITNVSGCFLNANMNYSQGSNGAVFFYNTSVGTVPGTTYTLDYGDSSPTTNNFSASHTYSANGVYTATLFADNNSTPACTSANTFTINVTSVCPFTPNFSYVIGNNGLVSFQSTSTGTNVNNYYVWYFGDGSASASGTNYVSPTHTYLNGTYTAWLSVMNSSVAPTCTASTQQTITVTTNTCVIQSAFTYTQGANGLINFSSTSTGTTAATTYTWNFGDGFTGSGIAPSHTYSNSGNYIITLIAGTPGCTSSSSQNINITSAPCTANAGFSVAPTNTALVWTATPSFPWNVVGAVWNWGDGSSSWGMYSSHTYSASGTYSICLTVTVSCGASATSCSSYFIFKSAQDMQMIQINVVQPASVPVWIESIDSDADYFNLYPNPNNGEFKLCFNQGLKQDALVTIYNTTGAVVYEGRYDEHFRIPDLASGVYLIKAVSGQTTKIRKLIINK